MENDSNNKTLKQRVTEMFGDKVLEPKPVDRVKVSSSLFNRDKNTKRWKSNYRMMNNIYFAQKYSDELDFTLAASFGKPIVNAITSFIVGSVPRVKLEGKADELTNLNAPAEDLTYGEEKLNQWAKDKAYMLYAIIRNALRDGDSYIIIEDAENPILIPANEVTAILSEIDGSHIGWQVTKKIVIESPNEFELDKEFTLVFKYRKIAPFKEVIRYDGDAFDKGEVLYIDNGETVVDDDGEIFQLEDERPLPIVHCANEKEPGQIYGNSEYRNIIYLLAKYSEILEAAIINNRTSSVPIPYVAGVGNIDRWMQANGGTRNDDGSWTIDLDGNQIVIAENHDFTIKVNEIPDTTEGAARLLEILFYLICQASETPEFLFGTAVKSSQASVETQMPIPIKKAKRKQAEFHGFLVKLFQAVSQAMQRDPKFPINYSINAVWASPVDEDNRITMDVAQKLIDEKCITKQTFASILGLEKFTDDIEGEIEKAGKEYDEELRQMDVYREKIGKATGGLRSDPGKNNGTSGQIQFGKDGKSGK